MKSVLIQNFFWSVFSYIWTEYRDLLRKSPYLVQKSKDQKKTPYFDNFHSVITFEQNKQIFLSTLPRTGFNTEVYCYLRVS